MYLLLLLFYSITSFSQVVPFKQRTSIYSPNKKIYNINGDFTMIGNTNLTLQNYVDNVNNNNSIMRFVDVDGDPNTFNSSSATLQLSTENNANPSCSNIIYAGLYWTGKSKDVNTFSDSLIVDHQIVNANKILIHNENIENTNFSLAISIKNPGTNNTSPIYTFTGNGKVYEFNYTNDTDINLTPIITLSIDGILQPDFYVFESIDSSIVTGTLNTPYIISDGDIEIKINSFIKNVATNLTLEDIQFFSKVSVNISGSIPIYSPSKLFDKRIVYLKGPNTINYKKIIANEDAIYYPTGTGLTIPQDGIFVGYSEITDYVKTNGLGEYFVADIALSQGMGGATGYSGGWGMIVVYENTKMKSRDVTIYDGYAYIKSNQVAFENLPINGFNTNLTGNVGLKMGMIASEGDVDFIGDYFEIQKVDGDYLKLHHSGNTIDNFFNSSIITNGFRNPSLLNNTGTDICMFNVDNPNNSVIGNNQTSANFKFGTQGDTYSIFAIGIAVDSYVPKIESILTVSAINNVTTISEPYTVLPGQEIRCNLDIKNLSTESLQNSKFVIPIPFNASYIDGSAIGTILFSPLPSPNAIYFDATIGQHGSLIWDLGNLPLPTNPNTILAKLSFKLKATQDCAILSNSNCGSIIEIDGYSSGTGSISNVPITHSDFIKGYQQTGLCFSQPSYGSLNITINASNYVGINCQNASLVRDFIFPNTSTTVFVNQIAPNFPIGTLFFNTFPVTTSSMQFSVNNPFPLNATSGTIYYAVSPNSSESCYYPFTISPTKIIIANDDNFQLQYGIYGNIANSNILSNNGSDSDSLNGEPLTIEQVNISIITPAIGINGHPFPTINLITGQINIPTGTISGTYTIEYQICEKSNPSNCETAIITISIATIIINANDDTNTTECGTIGIFGNVLDNDSFGGNIAIASEVNIILLSTNNSNININTNTGELSITNPITIGEYFLEYKICQKTDSNNCDTAFIYVNCIDTTKPILPILSDIISNCEATIIPPTAIDNCAGTITASTTDPLTYNDYGIHIINWSFEDGNNNSITGTQNVIINSANSTVPPINSDLANCTIDTDKVIDLDTLLPNTISTDGFWVDAENSNGLIGSEFRPYNIPFGFYLFKYIYIENGCFYSVSITMKVSNEDCEVGSGSACVIKVYNAFSPNNDSANNHFEIKNIDDACVLSNNVKIYNRWGVLVFETNNYDNNTNAFVGKSNGRATLNANEDLPIGTYFYVITYNTKEGEKKEEGYLYLAR